MLNSYFDVKDFGAVGDGQTDDYPAFQRALDAIAGLSKQTRTRLHAGDPVTVYDPRGAVLYVPFGKYRLSQTLHLTRQLIIQGVSGAGVYAGSRLTFDPGIDGIVVHHVLTSPAEPDTVAADGTPDPGGHGSGEWSVIRDVGIQADYAYQGNPPVPAFDEDDPLTSDRLDAVGHPPAHGSGIVLFARARIVNCYVAGFRYDGIHVEATDWKTKNVDCWEVHNCFVGSNGRHGLYVAGVSSNAGRAIGLSCQNNKGWAVYDRSQHGNTYLGCHAEANGHTARDIRTLLLDRPVDYVQGTLYAGTADGGVFQSTDGGQRWLEINRGLLHVDREKAGEFIVHPVVQAVAVAPDGGARNLFVGTSEAELMDTNGMYNRVVHQRLTSDGSAWDWYGVGTDRNGLDAPDALALAVDTSTTPSTLYAGTSRGVFRAPVSTRSQLDFNKSSYTWMTWEEFNDGLADPPVQALAMRNGSPQSTLYAGMKSGVFMAKTGDTSWSQSRLGLDVLSLALDPQNPSVLYAGTNGAGVWRNTTAGMKRWTKAGLDSKAVVALAVEPSDTQVIYAGTDGEGMFMTPDGGATWKPINNGLPSDLPSLVVQALLLDPATKPATLLVATNGRGRKESPHCLYKSTDGGASWQETPDPFYGGSYTTASSPIPRNVFLGCYAEDQSFGNEFDGPNTLVLGGTLVGLGPGTAAGIVIGERGILRLPVRSSVIHAVRLLKSTPAFVYEPLTAEDEVVFVNATDADFRVQLPGLKANPSDYVGRQFTIKRTDSTGPPRVVALRFTERLDNVEPYSDYVIGPSSGVTVVAAMDGNEVVWKTIWKG